MNLSSPLALRMAATAATVLLVAGCSDGRQAPLSQVQTIEIPVVNVTTQTNLNITNPTLDLPDTFAVSAGDQLTLVWSDEFDAAQLDPEVWFFATGDGTEKGLPGGWGNAELQYYLPDNAMLVNGVLEITARRESAGGLDYTSARLNTEDRFAFKYGRIEASIKLPSGQGIWPAFWMLSQDSPYGTWAATGEIDIMEAVNLDGTGGNEIYGTLHYGGPSPANTSSGETYTPSVDVTEDFHTYAIEWDEFEIRWYFDDLLYAVQNSWNSTAAPYPAPFDQPFHILLNVAVGGNFPGSPDASTPFPTTMAVDWVRVYSGEASAGTPADPGIVPDVIIISSDPNATPDLVFGVDYASYEAFGSGSTFFDTSDFDFASVFGVTTGNGYGAQIGQFAIAGFAPGFASEYATLDFKIKGVNNDFIRVKFLDDGAYTDVALTNSPYATELGNDWFQVSLPLSVMSGVGTATTLLFETDNSAPAAFTFLITELGFSGTAGGGGGGSGATGGEMIVNGDFETGDLTGWTTFNNGGTISPLTPGESGNFGVRVDASGGPRNPTIKQSNLGAGQLTAGQQVTISFDWKGATAVGGVVDVVVFSESDTTGITQTDQILSGGAVPADWTSVGPITFNVGPDVSSGLTLQITAICGGDDTCVSDLSLDNISITAEGVTSGGGTGGGGTGGTGGGTGGGGTGGPGASGEWAVNGDFESGDLTGWTTFENGGTITVSAPGASGNFAGNVRAAGGPFNPTLKQANLGAGQLAPGQTVTVSFDWKGTAGVAAIGDIVLFSELSGGGVSQVDQIIDGADFPADWTSVGPVNINIGPDVSGGITFQLTAICGGVVECVSDIFIDNLSITTP